MSTAKQKEAARKNLEKARAAQKSGKRSVKGGLSTADQNDLPDSAFAFAAARKEPLVDAKHVRNAIARFDQVEGVTDAERDRAWNRIRKAAAKYDVEVGAKNWRELFKGGKERKR